MREEKLEDVLIVTYDSGKSKEGKQYDRPCLIVGRKTDNGLYILNQVMDDKANETYRRLLYER